MIGITTYAGDFEQRTILERAVRHLRWRNGHEIEVVIISDGVIKSTVVDELVNTKIYRSGPSGLQQGELDSLHILANYAREKNYSYVIKTCGDVFLNQTGWANVVIDELKNSKKRLLSTHWFKDNSWIVGTKFFASEVDFLINILPESLNERYLEIELSKRIEQRYNIEDEVFLINSNTGELDEVKDKLADWGWEHAHHLYKLKNLDAECSATKKILNRYFIYIPLKFIRELKRLFN